MKILHIISGGDVGGAKTHLLTLIKQLNKDGIDCRLACIMEGVFTKEARALNISVELFPQKNRADVKTVFKMKDYINAEKFDVIHCHGARANYIAFLLKPFIKTPFVTTIHSDYKLDFLNSFHKKWVFTTINSIALRGFDYYIAVTENFKKLLVDRGFKASKIFVTYNGINVEEERTIIPKEEFCKEQGISYNSNKLYVGIAARLDKVKGIDVFLESAKLLKSHEDIEFLIAGFGEEKEKYVKIARDANLINVKFLGQINNIFSFYNVLDINTLTSYSESFPYALLEGGLIKKATVASNVGGIPEMIINGESGMLFQSGNHEELANIILDLKDNDEKRRQLGENFYNRVVNNFSSESMATNHIEIYTNIIRGEKNENN